MPRNEGATASGAVRVCVNMWTRLQAHVLGVCLLHQEQLAQGGHA